MPIQSSSGPTRKSCVRVAKQSVRGVSLESQQLVAVTGNLAHPVPEPGSVVLMLTGCAGLLGHLWRQGAA